MMLELKIENISRQAEEALQKLCAFFRQQKSLMIAYSGGMDSSFMSLIASRVIPDSYRCLLVSSPFMSPEEMRIARDTAARYGLRVVEIEADPLRSAEVTCNDDDIIIDEMTIAGSLVKYRVKGGVAGKTYMVSCKVDTSAGETIERSINLVVGKL